MIISDLQYIESADNSEVQGGYNYATASSYTDAKAFGDYAKTYTNQYAIADAKAGVSLSGGTAFAEASYGTNYAKAG
jgi:hypothetical protein